MHTLLGKLERVQLVGKRSTLDPLKLPRRHAGRGRRIVGQPEQQCERDQWERSKDVERRLPRHPPEQPDDEDGRDHRSDGNSGRPWRLTACPLVEREPMRGKPGKERERARLDETERDTKCQELLVACGKRVEYHDRSPCDDADDGHPPPAPMLDRWSPSNRTESVGN